MHVTFSAQNYTQMRERLLNQQADLGIVILPMDHPNLRVEPIGQARMVCICPPEHPLAQRGLLTLGDLKPFPMIGYDPHTPFGGIGISGFGKEGGRAGLDEFLHYKTVAIA